MDPVEDDFQELSELLFGARERYRSVRATVRHRSHGDLATEAINRYVEYGFRHGILTNFDPPHHEPRYRKYEDFEEVSRLWHERPERRRQETGLSDGSGTTYRVVGGKGPWWFYQPPDWADWSPTNHGEFSPDGKLSGLLDPYELRYSIRGTSVLEDAGIPSLIQRASGFDIPDFLSAGPRDVLVSASSLEEDRQILQDTTGLGSYVP